MKNVDIFVANRMKIIENLAASKSEIFHRNFVIAGGKSTKLCNCRGKNHQNFVIAGGKNHRNFVIAGRKFIETLLRIRSYSTSAFIEFVTRNLVQSIVLYCQWSAVSMNFQRRRST